MDYAIVDLEATCWDDGRPRTEMEIIEIGAVLLRGSSLEVVDEFQTFVKPVANPILSDFCMKLTKITQKDVEQAPGFEEAFRSFMAWVDSYGARICSWGAYDRSQFEQDCRRHHVSIPSSFANHLNVKKAFQVWQACGSCDLPTALNKLDLTLDGTHHRGIDDARNIAKIAARLLPELPSAF